MSAPVNALRLVIALLVIAPGVRALAISESGLRAAAEYSAANRGLTLMVYQDGRRIFSGTSNGGSTGERYKIYSGTKLFWVLAGLAAEQDGVLDLDERVSATVHEWSGDPVRSRATIRQLLNFTAGIEPNFSLHGEGFANRNALAIATRFGTAPGASFIYGPAAMQVFHEVLKRKLAPRGETPTKLLERRVLRPLGLGPQRYVADRAGNPLLAAGFQLTAAQWLRVGECILQGGAPVVNGGALDSAAHGTRLNPAFGMALWNNHLAPGGRELDPEDTLELKWQRQNWSGACLCKAGPGDLLACIGSGGQRLYVVPSQNLVVVRQGAFGRFRDAEFLARLFSR
jgi:CubicO group peptidase (beta-lactamase class C family)